MDSSLNFVVFRIIIGIVDASKKSKKSNKTRICFNQTFVITVFIYVDLRSHIDYCYQHKSYHFKIQERESYAI